MHSTVTILDFGRLLGVNQSKNTFIMRTLNNNQISGTLSNTKSYTWNTKRRYR
ncbi:hypothetical protein [Mangrovimonas cancribranchiae]|uniref:Uncharacterized protein n=1 Tax=Mangrovimonas cancribranchiae TaxID=3080055 RepID=A0AAU6NZS5_9FLAO